jgi:hypothetical protein
MALTSVVFAGGNGKTDLIAGGGNPKSALLIGSVKVVERCELGTVVRYWLDRCCLTEVHVHVADSLDGIPQRNGNPIPGNFDYKFEFDECLAGEYLVDIEDLVEPGTYYIAAHAVVECCDPDPCCEDCCYSETAWGGCWGIWAEQFPGKNWAMYFKYVLVE